MTDLDESIAREETRLRAEKDAAYSLVLKKPTIANRKAYTTAEKALLDFLKALAEPGSAEPVFPGLPAVLDYLQEENWKIQKSKLYDDFGAGKLSSEKDGSFPLANILDYARLHLRKEDGTPGSAAAGPSLQEQKLLEEVGRINADRRHRELKLKEASGELIRKSEVEIDFAKRIIYLRSDLKTIFRAGAVEIIRQCGGDPQKAPALISYGIGMIDTAMDRYARPLKIGDDE